MRPRTEAALALGLMLGVVALAAAVGARSRGTDETDTRASSYFAGPFGVRGLADGLRQLNVEVQSSRRLLPDLTRDSTGARPRLVAMVDPVVATSGAEQETLLAFLDQPKGADLLLAGTASNSLMQCFGYIADRRPAESVTLRPVPGETAANWPRLSAVLSATTAVMVVDSTREEDAGITSCMVPPIRRTDTLLSSNAGRVIALRLWRQDIDQRILLVADETLLRNRALRETPAGPFILGLIAGDYRRVVFDEMHQGFAQGGSLLDALLAWSWRSPWGWALWQLAVVGMLVLAAGAIRFGPIRPVIQRKRRSPLEHVHALATALAASKGHDVAIGAIVQGLNRRLNPGSRQPRIEWRAWVERLVRQLRSPRAQQAARTLQSLTRPGQPSDAVLQAANAVEDVWEELRP